MNNLKKYNFSDLYSMSSGISTTKEQAGHGSQFLSFSVVFNNYFVPDTIVDRMNTSEKEQVVYSIKEGDIFLTRTSEVVDELAMSCVALKDYKSATYSGFLKRLRPIQTNITYAKYMAFYLRGPFFREIITNNAVMTLRASLNEKIFSYLPLYLPEYKEQVKIGDFLFLLEQKIQTNLKINLELERMLKLLYDFWFIQFDFPDKNGNPYKASGGGFVYCETLKKEIPENWEVLKISDITKISNIVINPSKFPNTLYKHYSIPTFDSTQTYGEDYGKEIGSNKFSVNKHDILVSKLNPKFTRVIYALNEENQICSTEFVVWRTSSSVIKNYLYLLAYSDQFITYCMQSATGTSNSHKRVRPEVMMEFKQAFNKDIVDKFSVKVEPLIKKMILIQRENSKLLDIRNWLLPMLMNGQISIRDAESSIEEVIT